MTNTLNFLFLGDTLFIAGCGKMFEGSPEQMLAALTKLSKLPPETVNGNVYVINLMLNNSLAIHAHF